MQHTHTHTLWDADDPADNVICWCSSQMDWMAQPHIIYETTLLLLQPDCDGEGKTTREQTLQHCRHTITLLN